MAIKMVRQPSDTPNIRNVDDIIGLRYAYGNQNGFVIGRGKEISYTINGSVFTINSGRLVVQGVESDIDANGFSIIIDNANETRYYIVFCKVNLATNVSSIESFFDTTTYPQIDAGDDLNITSNGIANLPLYQFTAQNGVISNVKKLVEKLKYTQDQIKDIDERLTNLGFKKGSFNVENTSTVSTDSEGRPYGTVQMTIENNEIKRQGNYCIANLKLSFKLIRNPDYSSNSSSVSCSAKVAVPVDFRPNTDMKYYTGNTDSTSTLEHPMSTYIFVNADGTVKCKYYSTFYNQWFESSHLTETMPILNAGWEAAPI